MKNYCNEMFCSDISIRYKGKRLLCTDMSRPYIFHRERKRIAKQIDYVKNDIFLKRERLRLLEKQLEELGSLERNQRTPNLSS